MLELIQAENLTKVLNLKHGFLTRQGGKSKGDYAGLNFGYKTGDDLETVKQNYLILCEFLGISKDKLILADLTHSSNVAYIKDKQQQVTNVDALITDNKDLTLAITTADCAPILLYAKEGFVAAIHAGWRSAFSDIIENTVKSLTNFGVSRNNIIAAIFPTIAKESYEVDEEFKASFLDQSPENEIFFSKSLLAENKHQFDLVAYNVKKLKDAGISNIELKVQDTFANPNKFFSYRFATKNAINTGRHLTFISLE